MIRYANDIVIADLAVKVRTEVAQLLDYLQNGHLDSAHLVAELMQAQLEDLKKKLAEVKFGRE